MSSVAEGPKVTGKFSKLACAQCRRRKVRCDHNIPCTRCLKAGAKCTPSIPAPPRKRLKESSGLVERLGRFEALLTKSVVNASPSELDMRPIQYLPTSSSILPIAPESFGELSMDHIAQIKNHTGLFNNNLSYDNALKAMRHLTDGEDSRGSQALHHEISSNEDNTLFLLPHASSPYPLRSRQHDPVQAFRLWQIYLERVNPLTKIVHIPTLQPYVTEAATNLDNIPQNYRCLLFAVSVMATVSLDELECRELLGTSRGTLLQELVAHTRHSLLQFDLFNNHDMVVLQALVLFQMSLQEHCDRQTAWIFSGTVLRIATNMGYHRDGEHFNLTPFETEMRRRIWWQILLQDASFTGMDQMAFPRTFDTKQPQNFNDVDIFPGSTRPIKPRDGPTEMGFILIINRVMEYVMDSRQAGADDQTWTSKKFPDLEQVLQEMERRYINASVGGVHVMALAFRSIVSTNLLNILNSSNPRLQQGDVMFTPEYAFHKAKSIENDHIGDIFACMTKYGYLWFARQHFQHHVPVGLNSHLRGKLTELISDHLHREQISW